MPPNTCTECDAVLPRDALPTRLTCSARCRRGRSTRRRREAVLDVLRGAAEGRDVAAAAELLLDALEGRTPRSTRATTAG